MAKKKNDVPEADKNHSVLDKVNNFVDSPLKLLVFCTALLLISLTTGMLVGNMVKETPSATKIPDVLAETSAISSTMEGGAIETENQGTGSVERPLDQSEVADPATGTEIREQPEINNSVDGAVIASLPPVGDKALLPPWKRYAAHSTPANGRPVIAMVIDDVGMNKERVKALANLPNILTIAFLPYATGLEESVQMIKGRGHEAMLHLPMEPIGENADPGPNALLSSLSLEDIRKRTLENLRRFDGYVGVNNHMGSKFTAFEDGMAAFMDVLSEEGLLFLDSRTIPGSTGYRLAKERDVPTASRDVFIDNEIKEASILKQLQEVEAVALKNGIAIAIGHPHKETILALSKWMPEAVEKGFHFVPISVAITPKLGR